jgi:hypothetical protein
VPLSWRLGTLTSWNPLGHSRPITGLLYLYLYLQVKQERQYTYTVARSCNNFLQWKSNKYYIFWVCVFTGRCPACDAHAPYCYLWSARLYSVFLLYLSWPECFSKNKIFLNIKCILNFSTTLVWNVCNSKKNSVRYRRNVLVIMYSTCCSLQILMKLEFWRQVFGKILKYKIPWKSFPWEPNFFMRTD